MKYDIEDIQKRKELHARIRKLVYIFLVIILYNIVLLYMSYIDKFDTPSFYIYKAYVITTNSMEPELKKDDVVVIKKAKADNLKQGDIVTFKQNGETITHRIVQIDDIEDGKLYITKGDNNNVQDEQGLRFDQIEGKLVIKIPQLGKMVASFKNGIIIVLVLLISAIIYLNRITAKERSNIRRAKKKLEDNK
jgi:signal peptidase